MSVCKFNYKYIKDKATPGSWRRGYEGYQKDIVMSYDTKLAGVDAKVKGNFKDAYETSLTFTKNGVKADCSCPLKEEWCKHAIAVGLKVIEDKVYDEYLERVHKIKPEYPDEFVPPLEHPTGRYVFHFNPKRRQNFFSILVMDRETRQGNKRPRGYFKSYYRGAEKRQIFYFKRRRKNRNSYIPASAPALKAG